MYIIFQRICCINYFSARSPSTSQRMLLKVPATIRKVCLRFSFLAQLFFWVLLRRKFINCFFLHVVRCWDGLMNKFIFSLRSNVLDFYLRCSIWLKWAIELFYKNFISGFILNGFFRNPGLDIFYLIPFVK